MGYKALLTILAFSLSTAVFADQTPVHIDTELESSLEKLDRISYLPDLLPVILKNRDFIGLRDDQVARLDDWRNENRDAMLAVMKEIAEKRVAIKEAAILPTVSSARLQQMQNEIFRLQREILQYRLSCRDHIVQTFNDENWISFFMVLADEDLGVSIPVDYAEK